MSTDVGLVLVMQVPNVLQLAFKVAELVLMLTNMTLHV